MLFRQSVLQGVSGSHPPLSQLQLAYKVTRLLELSQDVRLQEDYLPDLGSVLTQYGRSPQPLAGQLM